MWSIFQILNIIINRLINKPCFIKYQYLYYHLNQLFCKIQKDHHQLKIIYSILKNDLLLRYYINFFHYQLFIKIDLKIQYQILVNLLISKSLFNYCLKLLINY